MRNPLIQFITLVLVVVFGVAVAQQYGSKQGAPMSPYTNTQATIAATKGDIVIDFYANDAPKTVQNFVELAKKGYYDGIIFHRVIKGFMNQGGDPTGTGTGGESIYGKKFEDEIDRNADIYKTGYKDGVVAMANAGPNTNGSQFFIMAADYDLPANYTIFGHVVSGMDVVDAINNVEVDEEDKPKEDVVMNKVTISEKQ